MVIRRCDRSQYRYRCTPITIETRMETCKIETEKDETRLEREERKSC